MLILKRGIFPILDWLSRMDMNQNLYVFLLFKKAYYNLNKLMKQQ